MEIFENLKFDSVYYDVVKIKVNINSLKKIEILENIEKVTHNEYINSININESNFLINAGTVNNDCSPVGLFINNYKKSNELNLDNGIGNFYLKPNGVLIILDDDINIINSEEVILTNKIRIAIQSGPLLINKNIIHPSFNPNSNNLNFRNGVGIFKDNNGHKYLIFINSKTQVNFYNFSKLFLEKYNCEYALCLESAGSLMQIPYSNLNIAPIDLIVCRYISYTD